MKIVAIADMHIGKDRIGKANVSPDKWDSPAWEAIDYAIDNDVDLVLFCGDELESRHPHPSTIKRFSVMLRELDVAQIPWRIIGGNHTIGAGADYTSSLTPYRYMKGSYSMVIEGIIRRETLWRHEELRLNLIAIPWIRPVDYHPDDLCGLDTIDEEIQYTREQALDRLQDAFTLIAGERPLPTLIAGHAMVTTGNADPTAPQTFIGKDIPLPLKDLESYDVPVVLGHIHQAVGPYVGSTQPTDFSDTGEKSFTVLEFDNSYLRLIENAGWKRTRIPYKSSLKVADIRITGEDGSVALISEMIQHKHPGVDIIRITIEDEAADPYEIRRSLDGITIESIAVERERLTVARVDMEQPLVAMAPLHAAEIWMKQQGRTAEEASPIYDRFKALIEEEA